MLILAIVAAAVLAIPFNVADVSDTNSMPVPPQARKVGETFGYTLHAVMSQSIAGKDAFGRKINQATAPSTVKGHEDISVTKTSDQGLTVHRSGSITAIVPGAKPFTKDGQSWTLIDNAGIVKRDTGKLGGLFLLPLPFLGDSSMNAGDELKVGDHWSGKLGTKLYGMTARPYMQFTVTGVRSVEGATIYTIDASGTVPMKEPVMTASGDPLGYATGTGHISAQLNYDRDNHRLVSMQAEMRDTLHYTGQTKHIAGSVKDHQQCAVSLDAAVPSDGFGTTTGADPGGPQP